MTCQYCNGNPPNRIDIFENDNRTFSQPMRYKKCYHCNKIDTFNYLDRFYNSNINRVISSYFWKVEKSEE